MIKKDLLLITTGLLLLFTAPLKAVNMDPESHTTLLRPQYAKYIEVQCYIVNQEQLKDIFSSADSTIKQLSNIQLLNSKEIYLFVRLRNLGDYIPFGRLKCFVPHVKEPFPIEIIKIFFKNKYYDYAFQVDQSVIDLNDQKPVLSYKWENLYCL